MLPTGSVAPKNDCYQMRFRLGTYHEPHQLLVTQKMKACFVHCVFVLITGTCQLFVDYQPVEMTGVHFQVQ